MVRFRQIPNFGSTIRGWVNNASEMKKLAARDFEDLLQVRTIHHRFPSEVFYYLMLCRLLV